MPYARRHGIRATSRAFRCSRNTVRKWMRRYESEGLPGLEERSRAPKHIPHKTSEEDEQAVLETGRKVPCYAAERMSECLPEKVCTEVPALPPTLQAR